MTDELAIQGNYADFKLVKTRSVCQLVIEVPIERAEQAIKAFGIPQPGTEIPVAVARINPALNTVQARPETAPEKPKERTRSQWAGIRCNDPMFRRWLSDHVDANLTLTVDEAAYHVRDILGIQSRKELDSNPEKAAAWDALDAKFIEDTRLPERH